jgi:hypothetical protein
VEEDRRLVLLGTSSALVADVQHNGAVAPNRVAAERRRAPRMSVVGFSRIGAPATETFGGKRDQQGQELDSTRGRR